MSKKPSGKGDYQGGYVAVLHSLEEQFYGPGSPINAKGKILLYIRHRILRDWETGCKHIGKSEIIKATGLNPKTVKVALKELVEENILAVYHNWDEKQWGENEYKLHPSYFGKDIVYNGVQKPLRLVKSYPPSNCVKSHSEGEDTPTPSGQHTPTPSGEMTPTSPIDFQSKPFLKNHLKELFPKSGSFNFSKGEPTAWEIEDEKRRQLAELKRQELG